MTLSGSRKSSCCQLLSRAKTDRATPSLQPHYRTFFATTCCSAPVPRFGTQILVGLPLASLGIGVTGSHVPQKSLNRVLATPYPRPGGGKQFGFGRAPPFRSRRGARGCVAKRRILAKSQRVVCSLRLHDGYEGPSLISSAVRLLSRLRPAVRLRGTQSGFHFGTGIYIWQIIVKLQMQGRGTTRHAISLSTNDGPKPETDTPRQQTRRLKKYPFFGMGRRYAWLVFSWLEGAR